MVEAENIGSVTFLDSYQVQRYIYYYLDAFSTPQAALDAVLLQKPEAVDAGIPGIICIIPAEVRCSAPQILQQLAA